MSKEVVLKIVVKCQNWRMMRFIVTDSLVGLLPLRVNSTWVVQRLLLAVVARKDPTNSVGPAENLSLLGVVDR